MAEASPWIPWQLVDSFLPTGGFAQSYGLETAIQAGLVRDAKDLRQFLVSSLENTASFLLPFVHAAHGLSCPDVPRDAEDGREAWETRDAVSRPSEGVAEGWLRLDATLNAMLSNHVANQASLTQGNALLRISINLFPDSPVLREIRALVRNHSSKSTRVSGAAKPHDFPPSREPNLNSKTPPAAHSSAPAANAASIRDISSPSSGSNSPQRSKPDGLMERAWRSSPGHHAPLFGLLCGIMRIDKMTSQRMYLYTSMRDILSASTRLNLIGPMEASRMHYSLNQVAESILLKYCNSKVQDAFQTCPVFDVVQGGHNLLFSRLFCS